MCESGCISRVKVHDYVKIISAGSRTTIVMLLAGMASEHTRNEGIHRFSHTSLLSSGARDPLVIACDRNALHVHTPKRQITKMYSTFYGIF